MEHEESDGKYHVLKKMYQKNRELKNMLRSQVYSLIFKWLFKSIFFHHFNSKIKCMKLYVEMLFFFNKISKNNRAHQ